MNSFYRTFFSFTLALSIPLANSHGQDASGGDTAPLSLDEVVRDALANNPAIQSARETWDAMRARVPRAGAWDVPKVSFEQVMDRFVTVQRNAFAHEILSAEQTIPISREESLAGARRRCGSLCSVYEVGKLDVNDWMGTQRILNDPQATEQQHLTDYETAFAELEAVIGHSLPQGKTTKP